MITLPTIDDIRANFIAALEAEYEITINTDGDSFLYALSDVLAGELYLFYLSVGDTQKNIWVDTADPEAAGGTLERFGRIILGRSPFSATQAEYNITVTGSIGAVIPATTVWKSNDSSRNPGMLYQIAGGAVTLAATTATIHVIALTGGMDSSLAVGDTMTATAPIVNVNGVATVAAELTAPLDAESIEDYRIKIIEKIQLEPGSWSAVDYRLVGVNINGVEQTYAYAASGASGQVNVFLQGEVAGTPISGTVITNYMTALELVKPLSVWQVNYAAAPINNVDVTVVMGTFPAFTPDQQALIQTALAQFINSVHPFIAAADNVASRNDTIATYNLNAAVSAAVPGYGFSGVTFTVGGVPLSVWQADNGNIAYLNSVTFA